VQESNKAARAAASQKQAQARAALAGQHAAAPYHYGAPPHGMALLAAAQGAAASAASAGPGLPSHAAAWYPGLGGPLPPAAVAQLLLYTHHPLLPAHLQHLQHAVLSGAPGPSLPTMSGADGLQALAGHHHPHHHPHHHQLDHQAAALAHAAPAALYATAAQQLQLPFGAAAEGVLPTAAPDADAVRGASGGSTSAASCNTQGEAAAAATGAAAAATAAATPAAAGTSRPGAKRSRGQAHGGLPAAPPMPMHVAAPAGASDDDDSEDASTQLLLQARVRLTSAALCLSLPLPPSLSFPLSSYVCARCPTHEWMPMHAD
jgi:hypothetical protein